MHYNNLLCLSRGYSIWKVAKTLAKLSSIDNLRFKLFPEYSDLNDKIKITKENLDSIYSEIKKERQASRSKFNGTSEQKIEIKNIKNHRKNLINQLKILKSKINENESYILEEKK